jgi:hypothetical protein
VGFPANDPKQCGHSHFRSFYCINFHQAKKSF